MRLLGVNIGEPCTATKKDQQICAVFWHLVSCHQFNQVPIVKQLQQLGSVIAHKGILFGMFGGSTGSKPIGYIIYIVFLECMFGGNRLQKRIVRYG